MTFVGRTVMDYVRTQAASQPQSEALIEGNLRVTYSDLVARVELYSRALVAAGVRAGDRVATLAPPSIDYVVTFLATLEVSAVWLGLNPRYSLRELTHVITDAEPKLLFARKQIGARAFSEGVDALRAASAALRHVVYLDEPSNLESFLAAAGEQAVPTLAEPTAPAMIVYTSGSTGTPKGAVLHQAGLVACALEQNARWPVDPLRTLNYFPINHVGCVADVTCPTLIGGGAMVLMAQFDPDEAMGVIVRERLTIWGNVPAVLQMQLDLPGFGKHDLSNVQLIVWEGGPASEELIARLLAVKPRLATNFSMTESTCAITILEPTDNRELLTGSVGWPAHDVEVKLINAAGTAAAEGEPGELCFKGPGLMLGYWRRDDLRAEIFTEDGYFRTGDLALRRADGAYRIVGRLKEMIKSGGYNVYPREIEALIEVWPGVALTAVVGAPDPTWQEVAYAFIMPSPGAAIEEALLLAHLRANLANYKVPKRIFIRETLPLLPIGKIDKTTLRAEAAAIARS